MRLRSPWICALALALPAAASNDPPRIGVPAAGISSSPQPLVAFAFEPSTPGPHAAVVMLHGCGGAYGSAGTLNPRHRMWGEYLSQNGYVALMLDSFTSRDVKEICTQKFSMRTLKEADRVGDAYAALAFLRTRKDIDPKRIAVLGWSHGGGVVLSTITQRHDPGFARAVSFYPGCTSRSKRAGEFHPYAPLLVLMGESDDWTPAAPCHVLADAVRARGEPMELVAYPDTYHDFDNPAIAKRVRSDVPNGVHPGQGVTVAPNPQAREDAKKRVLEFFGEMK